MPQILDGFTYSLTQLLLPISYRASALAQMEVLRQASSFQFRALVIPTPENPSPGGGLNNNPINDIPAYGQLEQQVSIDAGSYIYGWSFACITPGSGGSNFHIQVTDACTESALSADYILATLLNTSTTARQRGPALLPQPRLISEPGLLNVEIYNNSSSAQAAQLVLYCASPRPGPAPYIFDNQAFHPGPNGRGPQY